MTCVVCGSTNVFATIPGSEEVREMSPLDAGETDKSWCLQHWLKCHNQREIHVLDNTENQTTQAQEASGRKRGRRTFEIDTLSRTATVRGVTFSLIGTPLSRIEYLALRESVRELLVSRNPERKLAELRSEYVVRAPRQARRRANGYDPILLKRAIAHAYVEDSLHTDDPVSLTTALDHVAQFDSEKLSALQKHPDVKKHYKRLSGHRQKSASTGVSALLGVHHS